MESLESVDASSGSVGSYMSKSVRKHWWSRKGYHPTGSSKNGSRLKISSDENFQDELVVLDDAFLCNVPLELPSTSNAQKTAAESFSKLSPQDQLLSLQLNNVQESVFQQSTFNLPDALLDPGPASKEKQAVLSIGRPSWLPPKSKEEEKKHMREFEQIKKSAMRYDRQKQKEKIKMVEQKNKRNLYLVNVWEREILRNWPDALKSSRYAGIWRQGIPSRVRGRVWEKAIGNNLKLDYQSFFNARANAQKREAAEKAEQMNNANQFREDVCALELDLQSTMPHYSLFHTEGPLRRDLIGLLRAYSYYRFDTSYIPGTSFIGALLLLNMNLTSAFNCLANLLDKPFLQAVYTQDTSSLKSFYQTFLDTLKKNEPELATHLLIKLELVPDDFVYPLLRKLFIPMVSPEIASRILDCYVFEEDSFFIQLLMAVFKLLKPKLLVDDSRLVLSALLFENWDLGPEDEFMHFVYDISLS
ncbi:RabGAP [Schizosaccharomyces pombe]|uniref:TBC domain-containing protein C23D3.03c n=1 Tax=Schizosaccharomyces pombe (strain 972 / ATCC 24843) TaxID=284812 RepID=YAE3_SCHPO|nr:putative GTPase-activating protein [Schizosaccharomyces pombe]Q09844.1 RecName: Full=TBC domain-containing protein C23D3.03c [Schizosaccharomyces pombe 972h-]CAA91238.1 GTPase activating protein (predicted) [Schizosaccharomyces pombe]|eukprot:NP_594541.1 putative GTPase-activating protein [Schizosaccharomyces pombe]